MPDQKQDEDIDLIPSKHLIYLACPYSSPSSSIRSLRYVMVSDACCRLHKLGFAVFSPITQWHPINEPLEDKLKYEELIAMDLRIISHCDELVVLKLSGWERSKGISAEIKFATERGKMITFVTMEEISQCLRTFQSNLLSRPRSQKWDTLAQLMLRSGMDSTDSEKRSATFHNWLTQ